MRTQPSGSEPYQEASRSLLWTGVLLGIGIIGSLDEIVMHQLLQWHNLYYDTTERWRIISDGLFHLATAMLLSYGALRLWQTRCQIGAAGNGRTPAGGVLLGMGGFNLFDGLINHKLLDLHQIREDAASNLPYDIVYNAIALALLAVGWLLVRQASNDTTR